jgi:carboxyl-terminal processing protease
MKTLPPFFNRLFILTFLCSLGACRPNFFPAEPADENALRNFDLLWSEFDRYYGLFAVKGIDWDSLNGVYRPQLDEHSTPADLYRVSTALLAHLDDNHVTLFPDQPDLPRWSADLVDGVRPPEAFSASVAHSYLDATHDEGVLVWGHLDGGIGYINLGDHFGNKTAPYAAALDRALEQLSNAPGLVLDLRGCAGGFDPTVQYVAGRFAGDRRLYMTTRKRNGPAHGDFTEPVEWYVEPTGDRQFTKPIVLLTTRFTQSGGETFTLALRALSNVTHAGDTTSGAFSDNPARELWNGWIVTLSVGDFRAADGQSYEGRGLAPEVVLCNRREDVLAGKDAVLEKAVEILQ